MRKHFSLLYAVLFGSSMVHAQDRQRLNSLSFEIGKTGLIYNLSYDHQILNRFGVRAGVGTNFSQHLDATTAGGGLYYLSGKSKKHFEAGLDLYYLYVYERSDDQKGVPLVYPNYTTEGLYSSINLGYRSYGKTTIFRIGCSPGLIDRNFVPGGYISFGVRF